MVTIESVLNILKRVRFNTEDEKVLQGQIESVFKKYEIPYQREVSLDERSEIDFIVLDGVGIEVKIKGGKNNIYKQCERYCKCEQIKHLILVTAKSMGWLNEIEGKPVTYLNINKAWL